MEIFNTQGKATRSAFTRTLAIALGSIALASSQGSLADDSAAAAGKALSNPLSDIWALFTEIDYTFSNGDLSDKNYHNGQAVIFQPIMPFPLTDNWKMLTRPTLPIIVGTDVPNGRRYDTIDLPGGGSHLQDVWLHRRRDGPVLVELCRAGQRYARYQPRQFPVFGLVEPAQRLAGGYESNHHL